MLLIFIAAAMASSSSGSSGGGSERQGPDGDGRNSTGAGYGYGWRRDGVWEGDGLSKEGAMATMVTGLLMLLVAAGLGPWVWASYVQDTLMIREGGVCATLLAPRRTWVRKRGLFLLRRKQDRRSRVSHM